MRIEEVRLPTAEPVLIVPSYAASLYP
jgi:hypothetical protein